MMLGNGRERCRRARLRAGIGARASAAAMVLAAAISEVEPARAAVRACGSRVSGGVQVAETEPRARQLALAAWTAKAVAAAAKGETPPSWKLAISKSLACKRVDEGRFACEASAAPCVIQQVPSPPGGGQQPPLPTAKRKPVVDA